MSIVNLFNTNVTSLRGLSRFCIFLGVFCLVASVAAGLLGILGTPSTPMDQAIDQAYREAVSAGIESNSFPDGEAQRKMDHYEGARNTRFFAQASSIFAVFIFPWQAILLLGLGGVFEFLARKTSTEPDQ